MSQKAYLWILKIGAILSFICVFFVFKNLLFPYITSKQIPFNILTEVLFVFWLAFIIKYPQWNPFRGITKSWPVKLFIKPKEKAEPAEPVVAAEMNGKKNRDKKIVEAAEAMPAANQSHQLITFGLIAFFAVILVSCFTGVDFHMSFWSNAERMLGVFHILHFFILYLVIITVMRDRLSWQLTLTALVAVATLVAINGLGPDKQNYSTLGNSLYASGFMLFAFYFVMILFFHRGANSEKKNYSFLKWFYLLVLPFLYLQFHRANNTGEYVGFGAGVVAFIFLLGVINKRKMVRIASLLIALLMIGGFVFVFTHNDDPLVANNEILGQMNFSKNTFQTRLLSWESAYKDFHNHWLLGTGFGNYAIIFDKYFSADFFKYSQSETYFDRAHNNLVDITSTSGSLGLLAYLSIFVGVVIYLIKALRRRRISPLEFCVISSLFVAYFVQNLTVFDSFVTYMCLMVILGYVHWLANSSEDKGNERALLAHSGPHGFVDKEIYALLTAGIIITFSIYSFSILPLQMLTSVIKGQILFSQGNYVAAIAQYKEALAHNTPIDKDGRSMLLRSVADAGWNIAKLDQAQAEDIISFAIAQGQKNIAYNPADSLMNMELARAYDAGFRAVKDEKKKAEYAQQAILYIDRSIAASPDRVPVYFVKSNFLVGQGRIDESIAALEKAAVISQNFPQTYCQLGQIYLIKENDLKNDKATSSAAAIGAQGWEAMDKCLTVPDNADNLVIPEIIKMAINHYIDKSDVDKVIALYKVLVKYETTNAQYWVTLARLYQEKGDIVSAIYAAGQVGLIDPKLKADADQFIKQLQNEQ